MATQVKRRRGTSAEIAGVAPAEGEFFVSTDEHSIHVGDGATLGGHKIPAGLTLDGGAGLVGNAAIQLDSVVDLLTAEWLGAIDTVQVAGFYSPGDGGEAQLRRTGLTGIPSQAPYQLGFARINDGLGNEWEILPAQGGRLSILAVGAVLDGSTDNILVLDAITASAAVDDFTVYLPNGNCVILSSWLKPANVAVISDSRSNLKSGGSKENWDAIVIGSGNGQVCTFGSVAGFRKAIVVKSNVSNISFRTIADCVSGVVLFADGVNTVDNVITGVQIGGCANALVFEQSAQGLIQQGNEVRVNFASSCINQVVFDDNGTHTQSSNWDSNLVEFAAIDPKAINNASIVKNLTTNSVPNITVNITTWAGGWGTGFKLLDGGFTASRFEWSFAKKINAAMFGANDYSSCTFKLYKRSLFVAVDAVNNTASKASFNGGVELDRNQHLIKITLPANLVAGASGTAYIYHALSAGSQTGDNFTAEARGGGELYISANQQNTGEQGRVALIYVNISNATLLAGEEYELQLKCGN